ncbi:hypothetical protein QN360_20140, partial [Glaciimonas sp. CA11.2]|nr:hypothetical protein [Glaciimonas sp. CA11.2]
MGETKIQAESEKVTFFKNTMQAVVCHGPKDYRLQKIRRPIAGYKELVIKIAACGICASDCKC